RRCISFFFKQKTAYEISRDWSSDVCSSDLENAPTPDPRDLSHTARRLRDELPGAGLSDERTRFLDVHLRALDCSARKFAGEEIEIGRAACRERGGGWAGGGAASKTEREGAS